MLQYTIFDEMGSCTPSDVHRLLPLVSSSRREQALRYQHLFGRWACLKSYEMLLHLFAQQNIDLNTLTITYNEHGKPLLNNGLFFNVSHCKAGIAAVVADVEVGIDIERFRSANEALIKRTMNLEEQASIAAADYPKVAFTQLWTQKEAVLKWKGTGIIDNLYAVLPAPCTLQSQIDYSKSYVWSLAYKTQK